MRNTIANIVYAVVLLASALIVAMDLFVWRP